MPLLPQQRSLYTLGLLRGTGVWNPFNPTMDRHFVNDVIKCLTQTLGVRHRLSTPYYPQSNGKVERVIGTLKSMLKHTVAAAVTAQIPEDVGGDIKVVGVGLNLDSTILDAIVAAKIASVANEEVDDIPVVGEDASVCWSPLLHTVLWVYRATLHSATGLSPALLALGHELKLPMDATSSDPTPITDDEPMIELLLLNASAGLRTGLRACMSFAMDGVTHLARLRLSSSWEKGVEEGAEI